MLSTLSWAVFLKAVLVLVVCYYGTFFALFYRQKIGAFLRNRKRTLSIALPMMLVSAALRAQDGNAGISQANGLLRGMFDTGTQLMLAIGALVGLIGAVKVFREWNGGHHQEAWRSAIAWFGSCVFLVIVATVIKSFFGI